MKKRFQSKCRSLKDTETHTILYQEQRSKKALFSCEREKPNPVLHSLLLIESIYLIKFNPALEFLTTYKNIFSVFLFCKHSVTFCKHIFSHSETASFILKILFFPVNYVSISHTFLSYSTHPTFHEQPGIVFYIISYRLIENSSGTRQL